MIKLTKNPILNNKVIKKNSKGIKKSKGQKSKGQLELK